MQDWKFQFQVTESFSLARDAGLQAGQGLRAETLFQVH